MENEGTIIMLVIGLITFLLTVITSVGSVVWFLGSINKSLSDSINKLELTLKEKISTIEQLIKNLNLGPGYGGYNEMFSSIEVPLADWEKFYSWKENRYTINCLSSCDGYELLLMCWQRDHSSPVHSYTFQEGWIKVPRLE